MASEDMRDDADELYAHFARAAAEDTARWTTVWVVCAMIALVGVGFVIAHVSASRIEDPDGPLRDNPRFARLEQSAGAMDNLARFQATLQEAGGPEVVRAAKNVNDRLERMDTQFAEFRKSSEAAQRDLAGRLDDMGSVIEALGKTSEGLSERADRLNERIGALEERVARLGGGSPREHELGTVVAVAMDLPREKIVWVLRGTAALGLERGEELWVVRGTEVLDEVKFRRIRGGMVDVGRKPKAEGDLLVIPKR